MFKMRKKEKKTSGHERRPQLIWVEKPEAKLLIWISAHHRRSGSGLDVGNEESAIFASICNPNSDARCSDWPAGPAASIQSPSERAPPVLIH